MKKGFSLLEIVIVIVIVGILSTMLGYYYFRNTEKARWAEAKTILATLLAGQKRVHNLTGRHCEDADYSPSAGGFPCVEVYFPPSKYFRYQISNNIGCLARAIRIGGPFHGTYICIDEEGKFRFISYPSPTEPWWLIE